MIVLEYGFSKSNFLKADLQVFFFDSAASTSAPTCSAFLAVNCCYLESDYVV